MEGGVIDYGKLVDEAMHIIVQKVLTRVSNTGLPGNHHFFISFLTRHPGVRISENLLNKYPSEMTIVLQYQFYDLKVDQNGFSVCLSFNGIKEEIYIPMLSITTFADPSVQFGLQFRDNDIIDNLYSDSIDDSQIVIEDPKKAGKKKMDSKKNSEDLADNVLVFDKFRKKNKKA